MTAHQRRLTRFSFGLILLIVGLVPATPLAAQETVRFAPSGAKLPGHQLQYDAGFEVMDWNGDGRPDLFLPNTSMMSFAVHLNEGTRERPRFGHAVGYPVNLTETVPQPVEHTQAFATCDLNGDGLFDIVVFEGQLRLLANVGTPRGPNHWHLAKHAQFFPASDKMMQENARFATGPESMQWNKGIFGRQVLTLAVADWDGDGLDDLLICRFKDEPPGVKATGGAEQWTGWGRVIVSKPTNPPPPADAPRFLGKLKEAPPRGLYFYKNVGSKQKPWFDKGVEIKTPDGKSIAAPNPVVADLDGDGVLDLLGTETEYSCNAFRVDWPTAPSVLWFRRPDKTNVAALEPGRPLLDAAGKPVPAGTQLRLADLRGAGVKDLLVMNAGLKGTLRWYRNQAKGPGDRAAFAPAEELGGRDFLRFDFMAQPLVADWFAPGSRDLILHGNTDAHCMWALRRTALYRNVAKAPGEVKYEFVGQFNYRGDPRMVGTDLEDRTYDIYGSAVALFPGPGPKRLLMSVAGKLYLFTDLAADGLTFQTRAALDLPAERNQRKGWQEIAVKVPEKVRFIRVANDHNGMGNLRDSMLHVVRFEAWAGGKNWATPADGVQVRDQNVKEPSPHYRVQRPDKMFDPKNQPSDDQPNFTTFGYYIGLAVITLKEPVALEKIRFLLSDREDRWYHFRLPYYWQGKLFRNGLEQGEPWYQYTVEVSADGQKWTKVADTMDAEMMRSFPHLTDWDGDGKTDLLLGVLNGRGTWPATKEYRLYRNLGTDEAPKFASYEPLCDEKGKPLKPQAHWYNAYAPHCGVAARDLDGDGKLDVVAEGFGDSELVWYQNVSADPKKEPRFRRARELGSPVPLRYAGAYRYFYLGDVDGDGVPDLLNSVNSSTAFFKGIPATAPAAPEEVTAEPNGDGPIEVRWKTVPGATAYEVRWAHQPITELNWPGLPKKTGPCASGPAQAVRINDFVDARPLFVAVKLRNDKSEASELSGVAETVTPPLRRVVVTDGQACFLDGQTPNAPALHKPSVLIAKAQIPGGEKQKVILLRFTDLPKAGPVERATLELTTDPSIQENPQLWQGMATLAVSCNVIRDDWDADRATFAEAAPGKPWPAGELDGGGLFLSYADLDFTVRPRRTLRFDVTEAVRAARKDGRGTVSLLVRVDHTGPYVAGQGYRFCGPGFPEPKLRPRLSVTTR